MKFRKRHGSGGTHVSNSDTGSSNLSRAESGSRKIRAGIPSHADRNPHENLVGGNEFGLEETKWESPKR